MTDSEWSKLYGRVAACLEPLNPGRAVWRGPAGLEFQNEAREFVTAEVDSDSDVDPFRLAAAFYAGACAGPQDD